jgi:hypothetical protein
MMHKGEVLGYIASPCICNPATTLMDRQPRRVSAMAYQEALTPVQNAAGELRMSYSPSDTHHTPQSIVLMQSVDASLT